MPARRATPAMSSNWQTTSRNGFAKSAVLNRCSKPPNPASNQTSLRSKQWPIFPDKVASSLARDTNGNPLGLTFVGNVPDLKVSLSVETLEHQESQSGQRLTDLQLIKTKKGEFACTLEELIQTNLELSSTDPPRRSPPAP